MDIALGILIPFVGTTIGASMVFLLKNKIDNNLEKLLLGIAVGVMIAASIWSLIMPSISMAESIGVIKWIPASTGFLLGILFLLLIDYIVPNLEKLNLGKKTKLIFAVTLHNIPEGMAVGVTFAGVLKGSGIITMAGALALSIGIAIQNFPEGAIISMPLKSEGVSKKKSFIIGMLSGIVEPIAALITILLINFVTPILPYLLSFAAGAMIYVVVEELIPESIENDHNKFTIIGTGLGFVLMMILDVVFG